LFTFYCPEVIIWWVIQLIYSGIDIVEVSRIGRLIQKESFLSKIFTNNEIAYIASKKYKPTTAAGIFCAKEAVSKCLGTGIAGFGWKDIEISVNSVGKPSVYLYGRALEINNQKKIKQMDVSISHIEEYAVAMAVAEADPLDLILPQYRQVIPKRKKETHKGSYGRVGVIGGKKGMSGSVYFTALAALKSGSGLVYTVCPQAIYNILSHKLNEVILEAMGSQEDFFVEDDLDDILTVSRKYDVICLGPGVGTKDETKALIKKILLLTDKKIVLDADGLNCISDEPEILRKRKGLTVITPHVGEMSRLTGIESSIINGNREEIARSFSESYQVITVLKGSKTVVADGDSIYINNTGNPGMATAGAGDVLTGIIGSFIGQGMDMKDASRIGVYIHGIAGDIAAQKYGEYGMIATNLLEFLPHAVKLCEIKE
jgi:holo-[acyl-carrier-protein] synthase